MTKYLLAISVGPVQEFIKAARRTRDLWFGSYLLSLVSYAVASSLKGAGAALVFPPANGNSQSNENKVDLIQKDIDSILQNIKNGKFDQNLPQIANIVISEIDSPDPTQEVQRARKKAMETWQVVAEAARCCAPKNTINFDQWNEQLGDVLEFYAAWVPYDGQDYPQTRARLMRLLAGRKNCRDFLQAPGNDFGLPKSSLDGLRPTVLTDPNARPNPDATYRGLRLREGEQLDVVGVVKRLGGGRRPYPSVSRIAADPWVRGMKKQRPQEFLQFVKEVRNLAEGDLEIVHRLDMEKFRQYNDFPYEGTPAFRDRHQEWLEEAAFQDLEQVPDLVPLQQALAQLPEPFPYLAVLVADGDRMGETISRLPSPDENRNFSAALAAFSSSVSEIVRQHQGVLVYAGGDDVLAFVPVDRCLQCARKLHQEFGEKLMNYRNGDRPPTLSVGIAIGHFLENLEDLLEYGRAAEKDAKEPDRNGLAVHVYKRGGAPLRYRVRWAAGSGNCAASSAVAQHPDPVDRILQYVSWHLDQAIPRGFPYELREMVEVYQGWSETAGQPGSPGPLEALRADALRLLAAKQPASAAHRKKEIHDELTRFGKIEEFEQLAAALLVAWQIAEAFRLSGETPSRQHPEP